MNTPDYVASVGKAVVEFLRASDEEPQTAGEEWAGKYSIVCPLGTPAERNCQGPGKGGCYQCCERLAKAYDAGCASVQPNVSLGAVKVEDVNDD